MSEAVKSDYRENRPVKCLSYDRNDPMNVEDRQYDDTSEGIDWDEIIESTQDDVEAGRFAFNSDDYATDEEAMAALKQLLDSILEKVLRDIAAEAAHDSPRP